MKRSLRKGMTSIYLQHEHTGHSMGAKLCESEVENGIAILGLTLSPVDENQKQDEEYLHEELLISAEFQDETIIKAFSTHISQSKIEVTAYKLQLLSMGKKLIFEVSPKVERQGSLNTLHLRVNNG